MPIDLSSSVLVLLCGGQSARFGEPKGLHPVRGTTLIEWQVARFQGAGGGDAVIVLGHHAATYACALTSLAAKLVVNSHPERGPFSSLQCGLTNARPGARGAVFVLPVDVPASSAQIWRALAGPDAAFDAVVPTVLGRGGHPVRLSPGFTAQLRDIPWQQHDARLDLQLKALPVDRLARVAVDDSGVRLNLNTRAAFAAWESSLDKSSPPNNS